jgi:LysR family transcriptional regulator, transcriptional activator of nhaA
MIPFNYHHLYYFYMIASDQSVSRAAVRLKISQPALSAQLRQFEAFLGCRLFDRERRRLVLTEEGSRALAYAETIFNAGREFIDNLQDRPRSGPLRIQIGILDSIPKVFAEYFVRMLIRMEKGLHLTIHENSLEDMTGDLRSHALDLILSDVPSRASSEEGIESHPVLKLPVVFCVHKTMAAKYRRFPKSLNGAPLILPTAQSQIYHSVRQFFTEHRIEPDIVAEVQDVELAYRLMLSKKGIAPLNEFMIEHSPDKKSIAVLDGHSRHTIWNSIYIITKKRRQMHPLVQRVLEGKNLAGGLRDF